jgi:apolipoprotein N-acyltransferase
MSASRVPLPLKVAYPLSFASGLLYWLAFPGIDLWPLAFVALVPLFVALAGQRPKHGFWIGWTAGFGMTITGFYWLSYTLQVFSGFPLPLCWLFQAILCGYQAGRIALFGWLATRGEKRGWGRGLTLTLAFAASELLFPLLFPWFYGATVHQVIPLLQVAELGGPIAISLVLLAFNYAVAELVLARLEQRKPKRLALAGAAAPVLAAVYGLIRVPMVDARSAAAEKLEVGLVQANMSLMGKRKNKREGLDRHLRLTRELTEQGALDLVVWSETSVMSAVQERTARYADNLRRSWGSPPCSAACWSGPSTTLESTCSSTRRCSPTRAASSWAASTSNCCWPSASTCRSARPSPFCTSGHPIPATFRPDPRSSRSV